MTKPKIYTVAELSKMWNGAADEHNQWATLGIDEIIEFAQQACAANCLTALDRFAKAVEDAHICEACDGCGTIDETLGHLV